VSHTAQERTRRPSILPTARVHVRVSSTIVDTWCVLVVRHYHQRHFFENGRGFGRAPHDTFYIKFYCSTRCSRHHCSRRWTEDENMKMIDHIYPTLIPIPCAASLKAAMSARIAELDHTQAARNHVLQQAAELRESLRLQDEARKRMAEALGVWEKSTMPFLYRRITDLVEGAIPLL